VIGYIHYFALCLLLTYAVTGSALFMPLRVRLARRGPWPATFIFCPLCVGFWIALACAWLYPDEGTLSVFGAELPARLLFAPAMYITLLLLIKIFRDDFLASPTAEDELTAATNPMQGLAITVTVKDDEGTIYRKPGDDDNATTKEESKANAGR
jgi:hypothetical protein